MIEIIVPVEGENWGEPAKYFELIQESIEQRHVHENGEILNSLDKDKMEEIDGLFQKSHEHENGQVLNEFGQSEEGGLTWNGKAIVSKPKIKRKEYEDTEFALYAGSSIGNEIEIIANETKEDSAKMLIADVRFIIDDSEYNIGDLKLLGFLYSNDMVDRTIGNGYSVAWGGLRLLYISCTPHEATGNFCPLMDDISSGGIPFEKIIVYYMEVEPDEE